MGINFFIDYSGRGFSVLIGTAVDGPMISGRVLSLRNAACE
jgi:hypothetical protein